MGCIQSSIAYDASLLRVEGGAERLERLIQDVFKWSSRSSSRLNCRTNV